MKKLLLGIDIGGTKCAVCLCESDGASLRTTAKKRFDTPEGDPQKAIEKLLSLSAKPESGNEISGLMTTGIAGGAAVPMTFAGEKFGGGNAALAVLFFAACASRSARSRAAAKKTRLST